MEHVDVIKIRWEIDGVGDGYNVNRLDLSSSPTGVICVARIKNKRIATLLHEALEVYQKTGLSPRQLEEHRAELLEACKFARDEIQNDSTSNAQALGQLFYAIARVTGPK